MVAAPDFYPQLEVWLNCVLLDLTVVWPETVLCSAVLSSVQLEWDIRSVMQVHCHVYIKTARSKHMLRLISWYRPLVGLWCKLGFCSCTVLLQKKPVRESTQRQMSCSSSGSLSPSNQAANVPKQTARREWKYIASEKTASECLPTACDLSQSTWKKCFYKIYFVHDVLDAAQ